MRSKAESLTESAQVDEVLQLSHTPKELSNDRI